MRPFRLHVVVSLLLAAGLAGAPAARSHETGTHTGFASVVSTIDPPTPGLLVRVIGGHEYVSITNLTRKSVVIYDESGRPLVRVAPRATEVWREPRVGALDEPPATEGLVRNWRIAGSADGEQFEILGFLGYRPPPAEERDDALPRWAIALAATLGALVLATAIAVPLLRRGEES